MILAPDVIFDTNAVEASITRALKARPPDEQRKAITTELSVANQTGRNKIAKAYSTDPFATEAVIASYSYLTDQLIKAAYQATTAYLHHAPSSGLTILAVGGYGRAEMAPFSDVDLLFLTKESDDTNNAELIETLLYILWDLQLKIGHATRTVEECIALGKSDQTIKTTLIESRQILGDEDLAIELDKRLRSKLFAGSDADYIEQKLAERDARHTRQGGQRYMLEPNVKEGKGGLRDLQTLFWITKHLNLSSGRDERIAKGTFQPEEMAKFNRAHGFLWTVRCHLHLLAKRANEQLTFDMQVEIADRLGYKDKDGMRAVEEFMQDYFIHATLVGELTRIFLTALEARHVKKQPSFSRRIANAMTWARSAKPDLAEGYKELHGRLMIADPESFLADPINIMRLFQEGMRSKTLLHPDAMRLISANLDLVTDAVRTDPEARRIFLSLLLDYGNPERPLRRMNELGVLGAFIPEFKRIIALMQFNIYHHYTVDEHTIQCISVLADIESGYLKEDLPIVTEILGSKTFDRRILYVALLLHDIGKGLPEDHSTAGGKIAAIACPRLGLSDKETETVIWLIEHHLLMSDVAQKRDLSDPRTVIQFAQVVKTRRQLDLLTALTVCDIWGVGPGTWNNWKAQLIRELYKSARQTIAAGLDSVGIYNRVDEAKENLRLSLSDWAQEDLDRELSRHYDPYWQGLDLKSHLTFARLLKKIKDTPIISDFEPDIDRDATRACLAMQDHPGAFSRIVGAIALAGANIVDARTYTTSDGFATAIFWIQDAEGRPYETTRLKRLSQIIGKTLKGEMLTRPALADREKYKKRERDFIVPTEITFDNEGSELYSIIEVDTRDRAGLLFDLTRTLRNANIYVASAVIATYGVQAVDVFYVKDMFGTKIHSKRKQEAIADRLKLAIEEGAQGAMS